MSEALPTPILAAILATATTLGDVPWLVAGSTARALAGFATAPRDLDIEIGGADAVRAASALGVAVGERVDARSRSWSATAWHGSVEIDLTAGLTLLGPGGVLPPDFDLMRRFATSVEIDGRTVQVAPIEEQIVRILITGSEDRRARFVRETPDGWSAREDYVALRLTAARAAR